MSQKGNIKCNAKGELVEDEEGIKQVYENFYQQLLETPPAVSEREKEAEREVNETFGTIEIIAKTQETMVIDKELVRKVIAKLKRRKTGDTLGWTNEIILEGGEEMVTKRVQPTRGWTVAASTQHKLYSLLLPPAMGARFYRFLGRPAKWTRWLAGAAAIKSG